ncbi:MAG: SusC/RagA family TonB-linked outer membrane protein, partial [Ignavibacteriae bacterium]|nr:SusC/RagA family TonB-linked outer membrane protein [Ignavibacteriota bacterium]
MHSLYNAQRYWRWMLLTMLLATMPMLAQEGRQRYTITGSVVDAKATEALVGINVTIRNTKLGSTTDKDGKFAILASLVPGRYTLSFSLIGYKGRQLTVDLADQALVDVGRVMMEEDILRAQEVVVTGTGAAVEKERLGNSVSTVGGNAITESFAPTVDAALAGKIAGAQVNQNSGTPGGGVSVRLRGTSTISASAEPLYIIDGTIVDNSSNELVNLGGYVNNRIADINPNDIDHIEVVKGAAAAALYGSRANNGVIQIFTKRGTTGAPQVTYRTNIGASEIRKTYDVNLYEYREPPTVITRAKVERKDYQKEIFQGGFQFDQFLSLSGGNEATKYYVSGTYGYESGIVKATDYRKMNFRANLDQYISDWIKMGVGANYIASKSNRVPNGGIVGGEGVITNFAFQPNWFDLHANAEGKFPTPPNSGFANELEVIAKWQSPEYINRFTGSLHFIATPLSDLSIEYRFGYDQYKQNDNRQIPIGSSAGYTTGFSQQAVADVQLLNNDVTANHILTIPEFTFTTTAGFSHQYFDGTTVTASVRDLIPVATLLSSGATATASEYREKRVIYGYFVQETVGFQDFLFLTGGLRIDGASTFGKDERFQTFPKASLSFVPSNFDWWREGMGDAFNRFKLRAAWGASGGQPAGTYDRYSVYVLQPQSGRPGLVNSTLLGNAKLKPERMTEIELGVDFGMFNDAFTVEFSYYNKTVKDLLLRRTLPTSTGYVGILDNVGELENKGYELAVKAAIMNTEDLRWVSSLVISHNKNRVTKLNGPAFAVDGSFGIARVAEGEPLGFFWGTTYLRDSTGAITQDALGRPIRNPTSSKIGDPNPDLVVSFTNDFQLFEKLSLHVQLDGMFGQDVFNFTRRILETPAFGNGKEYEREL